MTSLKCLGSTTAFDGQLLTDVRLLGSLPAPALESALRLAVAYLQCEEASHLATLLEDFATAHGVKAKPARSVVRSLAVILCGAVKFGLDGEALSSDLKAAGLDDARAAAAEAFFDAQRDVLTQVAADVATGGAGALLDAEWRFGVTVATDDVGRVGSTFLQLRLLVAAPDASAAPCEHLMELSAPQFYALLGQLEKAKTYMDVLHAQ